VEDGKGAPDGTGVARGDWAVSQSFGGAVRREAKVFRKKFQEPSLDRIAMRERGRRGHAAIVGWDSDPAKAARRAADGRFREVGYEKKPPEGRLERCCCKWNVL